jgi:hypothetical protein
MPPSLDRFKAEEEHDGGKARAGEEWKSKGPMTEGAYGIGLHDRRRSGEWKAKTTCRYPHVTVMEPM